MDYEESVVATCKLIANGVLSLLFDLGSTQVAQVDSARQNLASTFVNAFVNAGFGVDKLMLTEEEDGGWIFKNKDHGMLSASASLGMILLWDVDMGLNQIDRYIYSNDENIRAGALLAVGIVNSGVRNLADPALAVLSEHLEDTKPINNRVAAIQGLGLAYAGSAREELSELLLPLVSNSDVAMELSSFAALALGMIYVGTCDGEITSTILQTMLERTDGQLGETFSRFMSLGLGLIHLGIFFVLFASCDPRMKNMPLTLISFCDYKNRHPWPV